MRKFVAAQSSHKSLMPDKNLPYHWTTAHLSEKRVKQHLAHSLVEGLRLKWFSLVSVLLPVSEVQELHSWGLKKFGASGSRRLGVVLGAWVRVESKGEEDRQMLPEVIRFHRASRHGA